MSKKFYTYKVHETEDKISAKLAEIKEETAFIKDLLAGRIKLDDDETSEENKALAIEEIRQLNKEIRIYREHLEYYRECVSGYGDAYAMHRLGI